jgi:fructoselysine transporter
MMRILIQFVSQAAGLIAWHYRSPKEERPYKMPLFPIPAILSLAIWLFLFFSNEVKFMVYALGIIVSGMIAYYLKGKLIK